MKISSNRYASCLRAGAFILVLSLTFTGPVSVFAFKPKTHVWVAQQVLNEVLRKGSVRIEDNEYIVRQEIVEALRSHQNEYRMGFIGPDAFPDPLVGQVTAHPGNPEFPDQWQSDDWLKLLLKASKGNQRLKSFAYGYIGHAASDIFAHTYVNTYAGDIFLLSDCESIKCAPVVNGATETQNEEKRHFALEAYISKFTPPLTDDKGQLLGTPEQTLTAPARELADLLIWDKETLDQYRHESLKNYTRHLVLMTEYGDEIKRLIESSSQNEKLEIDNLNTEKIMAQKNTSLKKEEISGLKLKMSEMEQRPPSDRDKKFREEFNSTKKDLRRAEKQFKKLEDDEADLSNDILVVEKESAQHRADLEKLSASIKQAVVAYINMSAEMAIEFAKDEKGDIRKPWENWKKNYAKFFLPETLRKMVNLYQKTENFIKSLPGINWLVAVKERLSKKIDIFEKKAQVISAKVFLSKSAERLLEIIYFPEELDAKGLNDIFAKDKSGKNLLEIKDIAARVEKDMAVEGKYFNPNDFNAVHNSIVLSKLTLLDAVELNKLIKHHYNQSSNVFKETEDFNKKSEDFNILFGAVRSIDGNHQWNEFAPPYLRRTGSDNRSQQKRTYGYAEGFKLWSDPVLREKVFRKIFRGPLVPALETPEKFNFPTLIPEEYLYKPSQDNPFPDIEK